jgi:hypothetical protein
MPKRHVYSKDTTGYGDFVYVDLLPEVRRARQFNMRVIVLLLITITVTFVLVYLPYSNATFELENINSENNDLVHELALTQEEYEGYEIDLDAIQFQEDISAMKITETDFNNLYDSIQIYVDVNNGRIKDVNFNLNNETIIFTVSMVNSYRFTTLNNQILDIDWVATSVYTDPVRYGNDVEYTAQFTIGVKYDAE